MDKTITFTMTEADFLAFNLHHIRHGPGTRRQRIISRLLFPVLLIIIVGMTIGRQGGSWPVASVTTMIAIVAFELCYHRINARAAKRQIKRMAKAGRVMAAREITYHFTDDGFDEITEDSRSSHRYSLIQQVDESPQGLFLYITVSQAFILPARVFSAADEQAALAAYIRGKAATAKEVQP